VSIWLRDATEDVPSPIPRGLRVIAVMTTMSADRVSADVALAGRWFGLPNLAIETVTARTAEDRVKGVIEALLTRWFRSFQWGRG
jgi:predicted SpoU family rRNA methylase